MTGGKNDAQQLIRKNEMKVENVEREQPKGEFISKVEFQGTAPVNKGEIFCKSSFECCGRGDRGTEVKTAYYVVGNLYCVLRNRWEEGWV